MTLHRFPRVLLPVLLLWAAAGAAEQPRPNVLFIAVDDLRPQLGCYGEDLMVTPHLDRLAGTGRLFSRHYTQVPTCGASRRCLLTGLRPATRGHLSNEALRHAMAAEVAPGQPESFAHLFKQHGYQTVCLGKISHYPGGRVFKKGTGTGDGELEMPRSWHEVDMSFGKWKTGWDAFFGYADGSGRTPGESPPFESADVGDDGYPDGLIAEAAIQKLRAMKDKPFLLAVGFFKPHLPFNAPKKYFDLYDPDSIPLSPNPERPTGVHPGSMHTSGEVFGNYGQHPPGGRTSQAYARKLRHAYFACVSYVDAQVGKVLDELERLGLDENTIVVVWGDHGWHLGDHSLWGKHTTFERALKSTLIVRAPDMRQPGEPADAIVETVDIYPTLAQLCDLPMSKELDGTSFAPVLLNPRAPTKGVALGFWKGRKTLRTGDYRLTMYEKAEDGKPQVELFDHRADPNETVNAAAAKSEVVGQLKPLFADVERRQFAKPHLVAWCVVPFDAAKRGPKERAEMLKRLGIKRLAYDWRAEHVSTFEEEILALKKHDIEFFAFWGAHPEMFRLFKKHGIAPQVWQTAPSPREGTQQQKVETCGKALLPLVDQTRELGCPLGLYNHGGWAGEPENLVAVVRWLRENTDARHVGIVYNFHHAHEHIQDFADVLVKMKPYLMCLNLNGMNDAAEPKILPIGQGQHERKMIQTIIDTGYRGPIGILDHRAELDAQQSLQQNLVGLEALMRE